MNSYKYSYKVEEKSLTSLAVYNVGYQKCESAYGWGPGVRDHYLIHYIIRGKGTYWQGDKAYRLGAGDLFIIYPYREVCYKADEKDPWEYTWVGFSGSDVATILLGTDFDEKNPVLRDNSKDERIKKYIMDIYEAKGSSFEDAMEMTGRLYLFLAYLVRNSKPSPLFAQQGYIYAKKAEDYIASHYSYPITVEEVADYVGVSRSYLFRCFQDYVNTSPKMYLTEVRIRQACGLLEKSDLSICAIARSVGFVDGLYFSKAFKKWKGISPREYQRQARKKYLKESLKGDEDTV